MKPSLTLLFLLFNFWSFTQYTISGKVLDAKTLEPLAYASVVKKDTGGGVLTSADGHFSLTIQKKDSVVFSYIGYRAEILSSADANTKIEFLLQPEDFSIEEVVVNPPNTDEIMRLADSLAVENHFRNNTVQSGFYREKLQTPDGIFKVTEASFGRYIFEEKGEKQRKLFVNKARSTIDSSVLKSINDVFDFKRESVEFTADTFIEMGQQVTYYSNVENKQRRNKGNKTKLETEYVYNGVTTYLGERAFDISYTAFKGKRPMTEGRFLIHEDSYAFLAFEMQLTEEANLKKLIPFAIRALLSLLGYNFDISRLDYKVYSKRDGDQWFMDKSNVQMTLGVAKGGNWVNGTLNQQYYMTSPSAFTELPDFEDNLSEEFEVSTYNYDANFWEGAFNTATPKSILTVVEDMYEANLAFSGDVTSERYRKWQEKQERKKAKAERKQQGKN